MNLENNHNDYDDDNSYEELMTEILALDIRRNSDFLMHEIDTMNEKNSQLIRKASTNFRKLFKEIGRLRDENMKLTTILRELQEVIIDRRDDE